jgi:hypothetical protein
MANVQTSEVDADLSLVNVGTLKVKFGSHGMGIKSNRVG